MTKQQRIEQLEGVLKEAHASGQFGRIRLLMESVLGVPCPHCYTYHIGDRQCSASIKEVSK